MSKAVNDATLKQAGTIYQYLIVANWYIEYERVKGFFNFILSTTANISDSSPFSHWNNLKKEEKLECIINIGAISKGKEEIFRGSA